MNIVENFQLSNFGELIELKKSYLELQNHNINLGEGTLEAADMLIYMSKYHKEYSCIRNDGISYEEFVNELSSFKNFNNKTVLQMNRNIKKFSASKGKKLHLMKSYWKWNLNSVYEYIKSGIFSKSPVLMVTWNNNDKSVRNKWFCIIGVKKYSTGRIEIETSCTEGEYIFDLEKWLNNRSLYKGLIYYK